MINNKLTFDEAMTTIANDPAAQASICEAIPEVMANATFVKVTTSTAMDLLEKLLKLIDERPKSDPMDAIKECCVMLSAHFELGRLVGMRMESGPKEKV